MKKIYGILSIVSALALIVCMLISSLDLVAYYEPGFYEKEYRKYNVQEPLKMEMTDMLYVTDEMMDYLKGYRADLVVETTVDGKEREFFNDREKSHMADVRDLFLGGIRLRRLLLLLVIAIVGTLVCMDEHPFRRLSKGYLIGGGVFLAALGAFAAYASQDFTRAFTQFHHVFFNNDLWLLDPKTDLLINMLPEGFFTDFAIHMGVIFAGMLVVLAVVCIVFLIVTRQKKGVAKEDIY